MAVQLYADGEASDEVVYLTSSDNRTYTWSELAEKQAGKDIVYSVKEVDVPDGYIETVNNSDEGNIIITNTHKPEEKPSRNPSQPDTPKNKESGKSNKLPKTGDTNTMNLTIIGLSITLMISVLSIKRRKNNR